MTTGAVLDHCLVSEASLLDRLILPRDQWPRTYWAPPALSSTGEEAAALCASAGLILDDWQAWALDVILSEDENGDWAAFETAVLVARQNGKGAILEALMLVALFLLKERLIIYSAHEFKTAKEMFLRIRTLIEGAPHLMRHVKQFRQSNEDHGVELKSKPGQQPHRLRFVARSRSAVRGFTANRLLLDEAQILPTAAMGAMLPALSAVVNPQVNYFGTVPTPEDDSEHWTMLRDRGRAGGDPYLVWIEWSAGEDISKIDLDDEDLWRRANPGLGFRLSLAFTRKERATMTDEDFARERLSIWGKQAVNSVLDLERWNDLADKSPPRAEAVGLGIDMPPDRSTTAVVFAGRRPDGGRHVEIVEHKKGTGWVVDCVVDLLASRPGTELRIDPSSPAGSLIPALEAAGVTVTIVTSRELTAACADVYDAVMGDPPANEDGEIVPRLSHFDQPALNVAVGAARKRAIGDAWAWARKDATDISPLVAMTLALLALSSSERPSKTKRSGKVW